MLPYIGGFVKNKKSGSATFLAINAELVSLQGTEPRFPDSESGVLPLDERELISIMFICYQAQGHLSIADLVDSQFYVAFFKSVANMSHYC